MLCLTVAEVDVKIVTVEGKQTKQRIVDDRMVSVHWAGRTNRICHVHSGRWVFNVLFIATVSFVSYTCGSVLSSTVVCGGPVCIIYFFHSFLLNGMRSLSPK